MHVEIDGARRELVQVRLPEVGAPALNQGDFGAAVAAERVAQAGDKLQAAGAATDDDDLGYGGAR